MISEDTFDNWFSDFTAFFNGSVNKNLGKMSYIVMSSREAR